MARDSFINRVRATQGMNPIEDNEEVGLKGAKRPISDYVEKRGTKVYKASAGPENNVKSYKSSVGPEEEKAVSKKAVGPSKTTSVASKKADRGPLSDDEILKWNQKNNKNFDSSVKVRPKDDPQGLKRGGVVKKMAKALSKPSVKKPTVKKAAKRK
jgi:hypothetical protein